jgi:hypothetical protein
MAQKNLQTGASYKPLAENLDPRTVTLRKIVEAHANRSKAQDGAKKFMASFTGKTKFAPIFKDYLDRPAIDFVETFADDETNPLVQAFEKDDAVNARRNIYSQVGAIEFHINEQLQRAGALQELYPEGMPMATARVVRPDKPKAKARRYSYNPGLMGEWLTKLDEYGKNNPKDLGIVKALAAQAHMGLRTGEIMNAPASAFVPPEKRSASWGFFLDTDTPGVKMDENLNIAVGPRTYNILQQALDVSQANDRNLFVNPDGSPIGKGEMTRVAKLIKVPGIMTDELTGAKLDSIQEAYDLRRMWVTLALNEFPGQGDRVGAAQGRAIGAVTKGGGAVKEYYSPSRGFYGKEATAVPNAMDAWLFEAQTEELPAASRPPKGQRVSYSTDFITGGPVFEPADAPITMGSLTAKFVAPTPKTEVIRPEVPVSKPTSASPEPKTFDDLSDGTKAWFRDTGVNFDDLIKNFGKKGAKVLAGAVGVEAARQIITEPAAFAKDVALEAGARAIGLATAPAAAVPMILAPTETAGPELSELPPSQKDFIPAREVEEETPTEQMARIATEDAGFIERNREPEAAPVAQDQGFLQPQP